MAAKMGFSRIERFDAVDIQFRRILSYAISYPFLSATEELLRWNASGRRDDADNVFVHRQSSIRRNVAGGGGRLKLSRASKWDLSALP